MRGSKGVEGFSGFRFLMFEAYSLDIPFRRNSRLWIAAGHVFYPVQYLFGSDRIRIVALLVVVLRIPYRAP